MRTMLLIAGCGHVSTGLGRDQGLPSRTELTMNQGETISVQQLLNSLNMSDT